MQKKPLLLDGTITIKIYLLKLKTQALLQVYESQQRFLRSPFLTTDVLVINPVLLPTSFDMTSPQLQKITAYCFPIIPPVINGVLMEQKCQTLINQRSNQPVQETTC